jgi:hypothetical protein
MFRINIFRRFVNRVACHGGEVIVFPFTVALAFLVRVHAVRIRLTTPEQQATMG